MFEFFNFSKKYEPKPHDQAHLTDPEVKKRVSEVARYVDDVNTIKAYLDAGSCHLVFGKCPQTGKEIPVLCGTLINNKTGESCMFPLARLFMGDFEDEVLAPDCFNRDEKKAKDILKELDNGELVPFSQYGVRKG
jgi:hypothetical protein